MAKKVKNGKIELLRFICCVVVICCHLDDDLWDKKKMLTENISFFLHGYMCVEFFFVVSGFLMAKSIRSMLLREGGVQPGIGDRTRKFLWKKFKPLMPYHIPFCIIMQVSLLLFRKKELPFTWITRLPSAFFLQKLGVSDTAVLGVEWYLSSMLIAMAVIFPLCYRYYDSFSRYFAPVSALFVVGYMYQCLPAMSRTWLWDGITYHCNLRAYVEICLGITCYEIVRYMQTKQFNTWQRALLTLGEVGGYAVLFLYCMSHAPIYLQFQVLMAVCVAVTISFSEQGFLGCSPIFNNKVCYFLGTVSMPIYLIQSITRKAVERLLHFLPLWTQCGLVLVTTILGGIFCYLLVTAIQNHMAAKRQAQGA